MKQPEAPDLTFQCTDYESLEGQAIVKALNGEDANFPDHCRRKILSAVSSLIFRVSILLLRK